MSETRVAVRGRWLPILFVLLIVALISVGVIYTRKHAQLPAVPEPTPIPSAPSSPSPIPAPSPSPGASPVPSSSAASNVSNPHPDLTINADGLSKATVTLKTSKGVIRFKFYPQDAPNTVKRIVELASQGFYNGLAFHRVVPGFVVQTGDPLGNGTGGSGQKIKAELNNRRHIEGTIAMARMPDPNTLDSADSQFYISLGTHPQLDRSYTVFGQVIEGMDVAKLIRPGDKLESMTVE